MLTVVWWLVCVADSVMIVVCVLLTVVCCLWFVCGLAVAVLLLSVGCGVLLLRVCGSLLVVRFRLLVVGCFLYDLGCALRCLLRLSYVANAIVVCCLMFVRFMLLGV